MTFEQKFERADDAQFKLSQACVRTSGGTITFFYERRMNARQRRRYKHWGKVCAVNMMKILKWG